MKKGLMYLLILFVISASFSISNVKASSVGDKELSYFAFQNTGINYSSRTSWDTMSITFGTEYNVWYTSNSILTSTYGAAFAGSHSDTLLPGHYYSIIWAVSMPSTGCGLPNSWNQFYVSGDLNSGTTNYVISMYNASRQRGYVEFNGEYVDACIYSLSFEVSGMVKYLILPFNSASSQNGSWVFYGYNITDLGSSDSLSSEDLDRVADSINSSINDLNKTQQETNNKLDDLTNMDIDNESKQKPDNSDFDNYDKSEKELLDKIGDVDFDSLDLTFDTNSFNFIWDNLTKFIKSSAKVFGMFISILSLGVIKLILGR